MRIIRNYDVASYYPNLMLKCSYTSRNIPSPTVFQEVVSKRLAAKKSGDKNTANALKLVVNTTYGAMLNKYNELYDPLMGRSVCITGQLFLLELAMNLHKTIPNLIVVQCNTDGIMVECEDTDLPQIEEILNEWQERTGFELEEDKVDRIVQKDVNNYVEVSGENIKKKGGYLVRGTSTVGSFNINNSAPIVAKALEQYFVNDIDITATINECNDIFEFQMIAKAGSKYARCYQMYDGNELDCQNKVNRVYATTDKRFGTLYKVHAETGQTNKIESIPEHCLIDNKNNLGIQDIDKSWYINLAQKRVNDFLGITPEKKTRRKPKMATTKQVENVYQKLLKARLMFSQEDIKKTGKNMHLSFKYFELEDIVPIANKIFSELGLIALVNFEKTNENQDLAVMRMVNVDSPVDDSLRFELPFTPLSPITSNTGKQATNEMQALGSSVTYIRRYLYMIALDICENDDVDANLGKVTPNTPSTPKAPPATPQQRTEVKAELTDSNGNASALQIKSLKAALKKLKDAHPEKEEFIAKIAVDTQGFTLISKADCEKILLGVSKMLGGNE